MASSGNICIWNPLTKNSYGTLSQGNLKLLGSSSSGGQRALSSFGLTSGKWYMEFRVVQAGNNYPRIGLSLGSAFDSPNFSADGYQAVFVFEAGSQNNGSNCKNHNDSTGRAKFGTVTYTNTGVSGGSNVFGFALDLDNRKLFISKDGTYFNSGNPANGTNPQIAWTTTPDEDIHIWGDAYQSATQIIANWGQDSTFSGNETAGGNADGNGFGDFKYSPPTGFLALCSGNLPISDDIDPAQTDDDYPQKNFNTVLFDGNGSTNAVTGLGFQPDLIWGFTRDGSQSKRVIDSTRGGSARIYSDLQSAENTTSTISSFDSDGFTAAGSTFNNDSGKACGAWCWRANGGTTSSDSSGDITVTRQTNTAGGFSILTYTGNGSDNQTLAHGLGKTPAFVITKKRDGTSHWAVWHQSHTGYYGQLEANIAFASDTNQFYTAGMTSNFIGVRTGGAVNSSGDDMLAYVWADVEGYSKFGKYEGNGNTDGPYVYTGFRPRMIFLKRTGSTGSWHVFDTARNVDNAVDTYQLWDTSGTDDTASSNSIDFLSNGFKIRNNAAGLNTSGADYVFGAWGDVPFKYNNTF